VFTIVIPKNSSISFNNASIPNNVLLARSLATLPHLALNRAHTLMFSLA
jgi:hypothetical protein